jgi:hypothetical protein
VGSIEFVLNLADHVGSICGMFPNWPSPTQDSDRMNVVDASQDDDRLRVPVDHTTLEAIDQLAGIIASHLGVNPSRMLREGSPRPRLAPVGSNRAHEEDRGPWAGGLRPDHANRNR